MCRYQFIILCFSLYSANVYCIHKLHFNQKDKVFITSPSEIGNDQPIAWAYFTNEINITGWSYLEVYTNGSFDNHMQAYAAGVLEGSATRDLIGMHILNTYDGYCKTPLSDYCKRLQTYLTVNLNWMLVQIEERPWDPYWHQVSLFLDQMSGLIDGYEGRHLSGPHNNYDLLGGLVLLNIAGDLEDLEAALAASPGRPSLRLHGSGSCSGLVKLLPENSDLFVSQVTWTGFNSMLKMLKKYDLAYKVAQDSKFTIPGQVVTFSSYPGILLSGDDFYTISSGLVAIETTIGNNNPALWSEVKPIDSVLESIRNVVANRLSSTGAEWANTFSAFNSGTYNNEWLIVDYKLFKPGQPLPESGLLYVLNQIPGMIVFDDMTSVLRKKSYWPSYNLASFPVIFNASNGWVNARKYGDWFTYDKCPRALIFLRDQVKVKGVDSMIKLMRYNDYTHDPLASCQCDPPFSAENGISARSDLNPANGTYPFPSLGHRSHGGTDMKMTTSELVKTLQFFAVSGPTYDNVPPFQWSKTDFGKTVNHFGQPDLWTFKPIVHKWNPRPT